MEISIDDIDRDSRNRLENLLDLGGEPFETGGNHPLSLDSEPRGWLVVEGQVEVFSVLHEGVRRGARYRLTTCQAGDLLFGAAGAPDPELRETAAWGRRAGLVAVPHPGTRLMPWRADRLGGRELSSRELRLLIPGVDRWVQELLRSVPWREASPERAEIPPGEETVLDPSSGQASPRRSPLWIQTRRGRVLWLGEDEMPVLPGEAPLPLAPEGWVTAAEDGGVLVARTTEGILTDGALWDGLGHLYRLLARVMMLRARWEMEDEMRRTRTRIDSERRLLDEVHQELASVLTPRFGPSREVKEVGDPLLAVCTTVLEHLEVDIELREVPRDAVGEAETSAQRLTRICDTNRIRHRRVALRHGWRDQPAVPLVAFLGPPARRREGPVALVPAGSRRFDLLDPESGQRTPVDDEIAESLTSEAYELYPPLPEKTANLRGLWRLTRSTRRRELWMIAALTLGGGLLGLMVPVMVGVVYGRVIPEGDSGELWPLVFALIAAALGATAFQITRSFSVLRVTSRVDGVVQPAVLDRLLRLPTSFFRKFSVGDLANRALGVDAIRELLLADITAALLGLVVSGVSVGLLFYLSWKLALLALVLVLALASAAAVFTRLQLRHQRFLMEVQGQISSLVFNLIQGIAKLRASGTEKRAYARWARLFAEQRKRTFDAQGIAQMQIVLTAVYALVAELSLFAMMGFALRDRLQVASFLAFSAAFGQIQASALTLVSMVPELLSIGPTFDRLRPILEADPEVTPDRPPAGELQGDIEVRRVSFRYHPDSPLVLEEVSLRARAGEFIAVVGPSGSGKTTLLRLLLGFEQPEAGSVLYDGMTLSSLDLGSVRSQFGVVLQNSRPIAGDIYTNIVGSSHAGAEVAWEAARMAGLEEDIRAMPMGLHTIVGEGATTFSGGQRQRLMIARALVHHPRIVFLDEATSALDNPTQEVIRRSLDRLQATRIVIAHRLSTIRFADRIYVLQEGRVVEEGTYEELVGDEGIFSKLVERQVT